MNRGRLLLVVWMFFLASFTPAYAQSDDFDYLIKVDTRLHELMLAMQVDVAENGIPSEDKLGAILRIKSEQILRDYIAHKPATAEKKFSAGKLVRKLIDRVKWKNLSATIRAGTFKLQNYAAQQGLLSFTVFSAHLVCHALLPYVVIAMGYPELGGLLISWPFIGQGVIAATISKKIFDTPKLKRLYGDSVLAKIENDLSSHRHQLSIHSVSDVLIPVKLATGQFLVAVETSPIGRLKSFIDPHRKILNWQNIKKYFSDFEEPKLFIEALESYAELSSAEKSALLLDYSAREFPHILDSFVGARRSHLEVPEALFRDLEKWTLRFEKITDTEEVLAVLGQAPRGAPARVVWNLWKDLILPRFFANNKTMMLPERRPWVSATESRLADAERNPERLWSLAEKSLFLEDRQDSIESRLPRPLEKFYTFCFRSLQKFTSPKTAP